MKNKSHAYKYGSRVLNWRVAVLSITIVWCAVMGYHADDDNTYVREPDEMAVFMTATVVEPEPTIEEKFQQYFPKNHRTMLAIAKAESGLNESAQNWNCWYNKDETIVYKSKVKGSHSTSCKKQDRKHAWSMDCNILQASYIGVKECPKLTIDQHLKEMAELSKVQGFGAWFSWRDGKHLKYLASN